jgi:hypothetical protein
MPGPLQMASLSPSPQGPPGEREEGGNRRRNDSESPPPPTPPRRGEGSARCASQVPNYHDHLRHHAPTQRRTRLLPSPLREGSGVGVHGRKTQSQPTTIQSNPVTQTSPRRAHPASVPGPRGQAPMEPCSRMGPIPAKALRRCRFLAQLGRLLLASRCPIGPRLATPHAAFLAV